MNESALRTQLLQQFEQKWKMLHEAIEKCPKEVWYKGKEGWIYSWIVYHIIETANFYSQNNPDNMIWGKISKIDWDKDSQKEIIKKKEINITKVAMIDYANDIKKQISDILSDLLDEDL